MPDIRKMKFTLEKGTVPARADAALVKLAPEFSRTALQKVIRNGGFLLNGTVCTEKRRMVTEGDVLEIELPSESIPCEAEGEDIPLDILYEDDSLIVINKPAGMVVHPAAGNWTGTVVNALVGRTIDADEFADDDPLRPGIVHRLDKDTSGCLVAAKTSSAMHRLSRFFADREVSKTYLAIVSPAPRVLSGEFVNFIGRDPVNRKKMAVVRDETKGRPARTVYTTVKRGKLGNVTASLLQVRIMTGRTHQIRVHLSSMHTPVIGDGLYGGNSRIAAPRQMLHAWKLTFPHPVTGETLSFTAPLPEDFRKYADAIQPEN